MGRPARFVSRKASARSLRSQCRTPCDACQLLLECFLCDGGVVGRLPAQPPPIAESEILAQPQVGVCRDGAPTSDDFANPLRGHADVFRQAVLRESQRFQELLIKHFTRRHRGYGSHGLLSVVIDDLNIHGTFERPNKANPPLRVDADAVLTFSRAFERFKPVAWRHLQIFQNSRPVQLHQLAKRWPFNVHPALDPLPLEQSLGVVAFEPLDCHGATY